MTEVKQVREIIEHLIGIDRGSPDHIISIEKLLQKLTELNADDFLIKNKGRLLISEKPYGNWDEISVVIDILRDETEDERLGREYSEKADYHYRRNLYLELKEEFEPNTATTSHNQQQER